MTTLKANINTANCLGDPDLRNAVVQADQKSAGLEKKLKLASQQVLDMSARNPAINPASTSTIERDLRDQVHKLNVDVQKLNNYVMVLTQQRDTAIGETTEAKSKGEEVYRQLQDLQAVGGNNGTPAATIAQYQANLAQKDETIKDLRIKFDKKTALANQLQQEGNQEISQRNEKIQQLELDATNNNQIFASLQQRISSLELDVAAKKSEVQNRDARIQEMNRRQPATIGVASSTQIEALKKELKAEKDKYLLDVNDLKNKLDAQSAMKRRRKSNSRKPSNRETISSLRRLQSANVSASRRLMT